MKKKRLRLLAWVLSLAMLCQVVPVAAFAESDVGAVLASVAAGVLDQENSVDFAGGNGTDASPYQIANAEQLNEVRNHPTSTFVLTEDIDLSSYNSWIPIGSDRTFRGTFDGADHKIINLTIDAPQDTSYAGLFGEIRNAKIENVILESASVQVSSNNNINYISILVADSSSSSIENCSVSGSIFCESGANSIHIGGIAGSTYNTPITNCANRASITVSENSTMEYLYCGGIVGSDSGTSETKYCDNYGSIHGVSNSSIWVGGIIGRDGMIDHCRNYADIYAQSNTATYTVAGIAGLSHVKNSVNYGSISGYSLTVGGGNANGIAGQDSFAVMCSYNAGSQITSIYGANHEASTAYRIGGSTSNSDCYSLESTLVNGNLPTAYVHETLRNGGSLSRDDLGDRIKALFPNSDPFPSIEPTPDPDPSSSFTFKRDNLRFINASPSSTWVEHNIAPGFNASNHYALSDKRVAQLTYKLDPIAKQKVKKELKEDWNGSCYGMAVLAALHYVTPSSLLLDSLDHVENSDSSSLYSLTAPLKSSENEDFVNYYHMLQYLPSRIQFEAERSEYCKTNTADAISTIVESLQRKQPVVACLITHEILLLDIASNEPSYYLIDVYDPNCPFKLQLKLMKNTSSGEVQIDYTSTIPGVITGGHHYSTLHCYMLTEGDDLKMIDLRNYFGFSDYETKATWPEMSIDFTGFLDATVKVNDYTVIIKNGEIVSVTPSIEYFLQYSKNDTPNDTNKRICSLYLPKQGTSSTVEMELTSTDGDVAFLLNDTYLSLSTSGPVQLKYDEAARTVDVTADEKTDVNLSYTQNTTSDTWPWHSWTIDTTDTTELHAKLDGEGLHLSGDGISGAVVATENAETEKTDTITLPAKAEGETSQEVTISNKKNDTTNDNKLTIDGSDSGNTDPKPTEPTNPTKPSTPAAPSSGSGDGDNGAGALLLVGGAAAAAAITAGVVLSLPVEVQGKAELADHTPLAGAKISLLKDGKVVEQTTADEAGAFSVKVKRGEYQLTAAYTNAEGQIIHQTINVKAPAKDLTVTF